MTEPEVVIDGAALLHNLRQLQSGNPGLSLFPVLKANAYGHGSHLVASLFEQNFSAQELPYFCVARTREAREMRASGVRRPLLILSQFSREDFEGDAFPADSEVVVNDESDVALLCALSPTERRALSGVHLNFNTGMNRLGFRDMYDDERMKSFASSLRSLAKHGIAVKGWMSHLARGEDAPEELSKDQVNRLSKLVDLLRALWAREKLGTEPRWIHIENSGGLALQVGKGLVTAARPGLHLWGAKAAPNLGVKDLRSAMEVRAPLRQMFWIEKGEGVGYGHRFVCARRTLVGTVSLGYADGIDRRLSRDSSGQSAAPGLGFRIEGTHVPVAGTVSMDMTMVDLTDHPRAAEWSKMLARFERPTVWAYWIGQGQSADAIAKGLGTISYEVLCSVRQRMIRVLKEPGAGGLERES